MNLETANTETAMPLMVTPRKIAPESGVQPTPKTAKPAKKAIEKGAPKSVREMEERRGASI